MRGPRLRRTVVALALAIVSGPTSAAAQDLIRSAQPWRTIQTEWFDVHFPREAEAWAQDLAPRLDAMRDAVQALVGFAPQARTTIVIDDPYNVANGKAIPLLGSPAIHLWVTPPDPTDQIGNHRGWALKLASHEFGHIAHLSRPARRSQWLWNLLPAQVSPLAVFTPRWATEGYATWIEGKITGSGRPHGAWRPARLRELALAGRLPSYAAMSGGGGYKGGSLAYLAGSAFWEWLAEQRGDTSMTLVFRRQSARVARSFDESFRGVYGDSPASLYARFAAELTVKAFAVDTALRSAGLVTGTRLARFPGGVGVPSVSRDGKRIALVIPGVGGGPPRVIVSPTDTQPVSASEIQITARQLRRDPLDVPALRLVPRLQRSIATLGVAKGRLFSNPRFVTGSGTHVLLESVARMRDGSQRPDLAVWDVERRRVAMLTHGAGVHDADPAPDGSRAVAVRCIGGACGLVMVSLTTGAVTSLVDGSPTRVYAQPRWSQDGTRIVTGVQDADGLWRLALIDPASGQRTIVTPDDDVNRHSAVFAASGAELVYVSEAGGIPNLESLRLSDGARRARTRVTGSVYAPAALPDGGVMYLEENATGVELYRLDNNATVSGDAPLTAAPTLVPIMPRPRTTGVELRTRTVGAARAYGAGPRTYRGLAQASAGRDGLLHQLTISNADPANRLTWTASAMAGTAAAWRGGLASAAWYGSRPNVRVESFWLEQRATRQLDRDFVAAEDLRVAGASIAAELPVDGNVLSQRIAISGFAGALAVGGAPAQRRVLVSGTYSAGAVLGWRRSAGLMVRGGFGQLGDTSFARVSAGTYYRLQQLRIDARAHYSSRATPLAEQFSAGGFAPPVSDGLSLGQRIAMPALPTGIVRGPRLLELRAQYPAPLLPVSLVAYSVGDNAMIDQHSVVAGLERGFDATNLGIVGLPQLRVLGGLAYIVRGPLRDRGSAYFSIGWRP
jgi:hypothetical protein